VSKFRAGAWIVVVAIPVIVSLFLAVHRHYQYVAERLRIEEMEPKDATPRPSSAVFTHPAVVVVGELNRLTVDALDYARTIANEIVAVHVDVTSIERHNNGKS